MASFSPSSRAGWRWREKMPYMDGELRSGVMVAGGASLALFTGLLATLFKGRALLERDDARLSRALDWIAARGGARLARLRAAIAEGIVWPRARARQCAVVAASVAMKAIAATHFLWAGLAVGVILSPLDYLFLLVFAGFALVLARFIRVPGGFVIGSGFALAALGVPSEQALAMILFSYVLSILLVVGIGFVVLWRSGVEIRALATAGSFVDVRT